MRRWPRKGDKVCVKGYENLPLDVAEIVRSLDRPVFLRHPLSGRIMAYARKELTEHNPAT